MKYKLAFSGLNLYMVTVFYSSDEGPIQNLCSNDVSKDLSGYYILVYENLSLDTTFGYSPSE